MIKVYLYPAEQQENFTRRLLALRCLGFQFAAVHDADGVIVALTGVRAHHGVVDIVQFYGEHDADAIRVPGDEPDILRARTTIWRSTGMANDVIGEMLALADPGFEERKSSPRVNESASGQSVTSGVLLAGGATAHAEPVSGIGTRKGKDGAILV